MKERLRKLAPKLLYPLFYAFCFAIFFVWTFPYNRVKDRIVAAFNEQQKKTSAPQELFIEELDGWRVTGVKAKGVKLVSPGAEPGKSATEIKFDEARAKVSILGFLIGQKNVDFVLRAFGGEVEGTYQDLGKDRAIEATIADLDLNQITPLRSAIGLPLEGRVSKGEIKLKFPDGKASKGSGKVSIQANDVAVGDGKAKLVLKMMNDGLTIPRLAAGALVFDAEAKDGVLKVSKFTVNGKDLELKGEGRIQMRDMAMDSGVDMNITVKISDGYKKRDQKTETLFSLMDFNPEMKAAKKPDGSLAWHLRGTLARLDTQGAGGGGGSMGLPSFAPSSGSP